MIRQFAAISLTLLLGLPSSLLAADIYKWVDQDGVPNFSEHPPEGMDYIKLNLKTTAPASTTQQQKPINAWRGGTAASPTSSNANGNSSSNGKQQSKPADKDAVKMSTPTTAPSNRF